MWLLGRGAVGRLRVPVEHLLADSKIVAAGARLLLDLLFTAVLAELIRDAGDLDVPTLDLRGERPSRPSPPAAPRLRRSDPARAYACQCAMCGFDGALGRCI